nr:biopolymer transporter ExbD [Hymenobacter luteus]
MTPMAGVGFLLVSFFMLTSSLTQLTAMEVAMPLRPVCCESCDTYWAHAAVMTVLLGPRNQVYYYPGLDAQASRKTDYSATGLRQALLSAQREYGPLTVLVKPSSQATYQNVVDALDEMSITATKSYLLTTDLNRFDEKLLTGRRL